MKNKFNAFTLVEVLITVAVVGIVAALTIPSLLTTISNKVKSHKIMVFEKKINNSTNLLAIDNGIGPYYDSTMSFVKALSKHLKIVTICDSTNINSCVPYTKVIKHNGTEKNVSDYFSDNVIKMGQVFGNYGETVAITVADGTTMVLAWNKDCPVLDSDGTHKDGTTSSCISGWYDLNGPKAPNRWGEDIVGFNYGYTDVFYPTPISKSECERLKSKLGIKYCKYDKDYWAGTVKECNGVDNLPDKKDFDALANIFYNTENGANIRVNFLKTSLTTPTRYQEIGLWSKNEVSADRAYWQQFRYDGVWYGYLSNHRTFRVCNSTYGGMKAICKGMD